jgi:hypothetical protein
MLFIFTETADRFWIAFLLFRLESCQIEHCVFLLLLLKDPCSFGTHPLTLPVGKSMKHMTLVLHDTALSGSCGKEGRDSRKQSLMP